MRAMYLFLFSALCSGVSGLKIQEPVVEERAAQESPRTPYSSLKDFHEEMKKWSAFHEKLATEASMYKPSEPGHYKLAMIGDSITESWRGTSYDGPKDRTQGVSETFNATLATRWPQPLVLAISGDQTQHLLWRLSHGELSPTMAADPRLMFSVLIGTNNIGKAEQDRHSASETYEGIMAVARRLLEKAKGKVLLNALLPRGDGEPDLRELCPGPHCDLKGRPFHSFMEKIEFVNKKLASSTEALAQEFPGRVNFIDCGGLFRTNAKDPSQEEEVIVDLMPDRLHPNAKGHGFMAKCLQAALEKLEAQ